MEHAIQWILDVTKGWTEEVCNCINYNTSNNIKTVFTWLYHSFSNTNHLLLSFFYFQTDFLSAHIFSQRRDLSWLISFIYLIQITGQREEFLWRIASIGLKRNMNDRMLLVWQAAFRGLQYKECKRRGLGWGGGVDFVNAKYCFIQFHRNWVTVCRECVNLTACASTSCLTPVHNAQNMHKSVLFSPLEARVKNVRDPLCDLFKMCAPGLCGCSPACWTGKES